jgi:hypothetical protein
MTPSERLSAALDRLYGRLWDLERRLEWRRRHVTDERTAAREAQRSAGLERWQRERGDD